MASLAKRTDGRWRARYRDEAGREHARHFTRQVDAKRWLDEVTAAMVTGQYVDPGAGRATFADYYAEWSTRQVWVAGTHRAMAQAASSVEFAAVPLRTIRRSHVETWVKGMAGRGLAPTTIATRFNNVHAVFRAAVRDRLIAADPADGVVLPRRRRADAALTLPTVEQIGALLDAAGEPFRPMLALAAFAGLRLGELCGLQLGDVEFLARTVQVRRQVQRERASGLEVRAPKYGSERPIALADGLVEILSVHVARRGLTEPRAWLFEGDDDGPLHGSSVGRSWQRTRRSAGVTGVKLHDLRHFYASGLIAAGCDVVTVQRALGHAKATTTLNTYAHLWPSAEDRTRAAASRLLSAAVGSVADSGRTSDSSHPG